MIEFFEFKNLRVDVSFERFKFLHSVLFSILSSDLSIHMIEIVSFSIYMKNRKNEIFIAFFYEIEKGIKISQIVNLFVAFLKNVEKTLKSKIYIDSATVVLKKFHDLLNVFFKKKIDKFSFHRFYDHKIVLIEEIVFFSNSLYKMSILELQVLQKYLKKNLAKRFIRSNSSFVSFSVLFARKSFEKLRFCVNYRAFNIITIKNRYSLFLIQEILNRLIKAMIFFKFDIVTVFNKLRIQKKQK